MSNKLKIQDATSRMEGTRDTKQQTEENSTDDQ